MNYQELCATRVLRIAEGIARLAHAYQTERLSDDEYIRHVERVVARVDSAEAKAVAWLHDVLEDSRWTVDCLHAAGISRRVIRSVQLLTRCPEVSYARYIDIIAEAGDPMAAAVKLADLADHLRPMDPPVLTPSLRARYEWALQRLMLMDAPPESGTGR